MPDRWWRLGNRERTLFSEHDESDEHRFVGVPATVVP